MPNVNDDSDAVSELSSIQFKRNTPKNDQSTKNSKMERDKEVSPKSTSFKKGTSLADKELPKITSLERGTSIGSIAEKQIMHERTASHSKKQPTASSDSQRQNALLAYKKLYNSTAQVVKNMIFEDMKGNLGRYTGEVNEQKLPQGTGDFIFDNGSMQRGNWVSVVLFCLVYCPSFISSLAIILLLT